jgi:hypothetical protein
MARRTHASGTSVTLVITFANTSSAQSHRIATEQGNIGTVTMAISCAEAAKGPFSRGLALLHSFV